MIYFATIYVIYGTSEKLLLPPLDETRCYFASVTPPRFLMKVTVSFWKWIMNAQCENKRHIVLYTTDTGWTRCTNQICSVIITKLQNSYTILSLHSLQPTQNTFSSNTLPLNHCTMKFCMRTSVLHVRSTLIKNQIDKNFNMALTKLFMFYCKSFANMKSIQFWFYNFLRNRSSRSLTRNGQFGAKKFFIIKSHLAAIIKKDHNWNYIDFFNVFTTKRISSIEAPKRRKYLPKNVPFSRN